MTAIIKTILCCQALLGAGALPTKTRGLRGAAKTIGGLKTFDGDYTHEVKTTLELVSTALSRPDVGESVAARRLTADVEGIPEDCILALVDIIQNGGLKLQDWPTCHDNLVVVMQAVLSKPEAFEYASDEAQKSLLIQLAAKHMKPDLWVPKTVVVRVPLS